MGKGDELVLQETPEGILLTLCDSEFVRQMEVAERVMQEDRELLRKLAE